MQSSTHARFLQFTVIEVAKTLASGEQITISKIAWRGPSERSASELLMPASEEDKSAQDDAVDFLQEVLWDGPKPTKQVQLEAKRRGLSHGEQSGERSRRRGRRVKNPASMGSEDHEAGIAKGAKTPKRANKKHGPLRQIWPPWAEAKSKPALWEVIVIRHRYVFDRPLTDVAQFQAVYQAAQRITDGHTFGPSSHCAICGKGLDDNQSIERGIGSECWQYVLERITAMGRGEHD